MHARIRVAGNWGAHASSLNSNHTVLHFICRYKVRFNSMMLEVVAYAIEQRITMHVFECSYSETEALSNSLNAK